MRGGNSLLPVDALGGEDKNKERMIDIWLRNYFNCNIDTEDENLNH